MIINIKNNYFNLKFEGFKKKNLFLNSKNLENYCQKSRLKPKNMNKIFSLNKKKVASIGTLGVISKNLNWKHNTTIDPVNIHKILQKLKKLKIENVILGPQAMDKTA